MVLLAELRVFNLCILWWCCLVLFKGSTGCQMQYAGRSNVTTELQSDVLLPCIFEPTLLGSNKSADIAAVWSRKNITVDNLVEIKLQGDVMFWSTRGRRITPFPKLESGIFSILLRNVQQSDLGLYRCELFNGTNCMIAHQEVHLVVAFGDADVAVSENQIAIIAGTSGGVVLLLFTACVCYIGSKGRHCRRQEDVQERVLDNPVYDSVYTIRDSQSRNKGRSDNPIYENAESLAMQDENINTPNY